MLLPARRAPAELEATCPIWRRAKLLALLPVAAELVVGGALFSILQNFVGFLHPLELGLRVRFLAYVGVKLACQTAIGFLDLIRRRGARDTESLVVILVFHERAALR